ncbi:hypothetical protein BJ973_002033 [Actinoplanes tereljensis]|uniref:ABC transporter permease n=1 Tax=Paractinoplanes tereljensis TaxID=571912 RepID=A0A919TS21_9ACTN|nr:hypothetical protein [Actinoplanes tereljensis]GIF20061.1 hypothetical protein Ate02nite_27910 [Actinoplanes tereljensis]
MTRSLGDAIAAEIVKLRGLPAAVATMLGTVAAGGVLAAVVTASTEGADILPVTIPFLQIGPILLGVLAVSTEYTGHQIRTTLIATPNRLVVLAAKSVAYLAASMITSVAALGAALASARVTPAGHHPPTRIGWPPAGATAYLVLIGFLGFAVTVLARSLVPPLVAMLTLVLIASPLLAGFTEHSRWLPDRAGRLLYQPGADAVLAPGTGALTLLAWITAVAVLAIATFRTRDA